MKEAKHHLLTFLYVLTNFVHNFSTCIFFLLLVLNEKCSLDQLIISDILYLFCTVLVLLVFIDSIVVVCVCWYVLVCCPCEGFSDMFAMFACVADCLWSVGGISGTWCS